MEELGDRAAVRVGLFLFQAEDGIRDWSVTGVQTCALPISLEVNDFRTAFASPGSKVFAHLPIHRGFKRIFDRQGATFYKEESVKRGHTHHPCKGIDRKSTRLNSSH